MNEENELLEGVLDDPDDDAIRLVFADWLEEHRQEERAEFIRLQIQLDRMPWEDHRRGVCEIRAQRLLAAHRDEWERPLPAWARGAVIFHRGFAEELSVLASQWLEGSHELLRVAPIQWLHLRSPEFCLKELAVSDSLAKITSLNLYHNRIGPDGMRLLIGSPFLTRLRTLFLTGNGIGEEGAAALVNSQCVRGIRGLSLRENVLANGGGIRVASGMWDSLQWLNLSENGIGNSTLRALADSRHLGELFSLDLASNMIEPSGLAMLTCAKMDRLTELNLSANFIADDGVKILAHWKRPRPWSALRLWSNAIGDAGAIELATSPLMVGIRALDLSGNRISDAGTHALAESPYLESVYKLDLRENRLSELGRREIRSKFGDRVSL